MNTHPAPSHTALGGSQSRVTSPDSQSSSLARPGLRVEGRAPASVPQPAGPSSGCLAGNPGGKEKKRVSIEGGFERNWGAVLASGGREWKSGVRNCSVSISSPSRFRISRFQTTPLGLSEFPARLAHT